MPINNDFFFLYSTVGLMNASPTCYVSQAIQRAIPWVVDAKARAPNMHCSRGLLVTWSRLERSRESVYQLPLYLEKIEVSFYMHAN